MHFLPPSSPPPPQKFSQKGLIISAPSNLNFLPFWIQILVVDTISLIQNFLIMARKFSFFSHLFNSATFCPGAFNISYYKFLDSLLLCHDMSSKEQLHSKLKITKRLKSLEKELKLSLSICSSVGTGSKFFRFIFNRLKTF